MSTHAADHPSAVNTNTQTNNNKLNTTHRQQTQTTTNLDHQCCLMKGEVASWVLASLVPSWQLAWEQAMAKSIYS